MVFISDILFFASLFYLFHAQDVTVSEASPSKALSPQTDNTTTEKHKWVLQVFEEGKENFSLISDGISSDCQRDFKTYQLNVDNQTIWAIRMLESSEWPHMGLFGGVTVSLGNWDECLRSRGPSDIQGQYCLSDATYDYHFANAAQSPDAWDDWPAENASAWEVMKMYETIISRHSRRNISWAMCIPSSCQPSDLQNALNKALKPVFEQNDMSIRVAVDPMKCKIRTEITYSTAFIYSLALILSIIWLVLLASLYDVFKKSPSPDSKNYNEENEDTSVVVKLVTCFSVIQSWKALWRTSPNVFGLVYAHKVLSFIIVVIAHGAMFSYPFPKLEEEDSELIYRPFKIGLGFHGIVDVFLVTSGFLTFYFGLQPTKKFGLIYVVSMIVLRWLRLIPVMGLVLLFFVNIMPYLGDGPLFSTRFLKQVQYCSENWWINMLTINNLVNRKEMCLPNTWYIAVDFQLTILGGFLLIILSKNYRLGIFFIILSIAAGMAMSGYVIASEHLSGIPMPVIMDVEIMRRWPAFTDIYIQIFSRTGPYLIGGLSALILDKLKRKKWKPSNMMILIAVTISFMGYVAQIYGFILLQINRPYNVVENVLFGITHRMLMVLPTGTFYVLFLLRRIRIISDILDWRALLPFGRIAYGVYLLSIPIQLFYFSTVRQNITGSGNMDLFWRSCSDILISVMAATILFYISEGPITNMIHLLKVWITNKSKNSLSCEGSLKQIK